MNKKIILIFTLFAFFISCNHNPTGYKYDKATVDKLLAEGDKLKGGSLNDYVNGPLYKILQHISKENNIKALEDSRKSSKEEFNSALKKLATFVFKEFNLEKRWGIKLKDVLLPIDQSK